jgi:heme oxygenase
MNAIAQCATLADRLREATRTAHRALDHHPLLAPLTRTPLAPGDYRNALAALHGPQQAIEKLLVGFAPEIEFPPRLADLESDLMALGASPFPLMAELPQFDTINQLIGAMYVIEGSNLGGAVIARLLAESLPAAMPRTFFSNSGGKARWEKFWAFSTGYCCEESFALVADAACLTFNLYKTHLDQCQLGIEP